jgi:hypothetical protein
LSGRDEPKAVTERTFAGFHAWSPALLGTRRAQRSDLSGPQIAGTLSKVLGTLVPASTGFLAISTPAHDPNVPDRFLKARRRAPPIDLFEERCTCVGHRL